MSEAADKKADARMMRKGFMRCNTCGYKAKNEILKRCARCKHAAYCSIECQHKDWKAHKPICNAAVKTKKESSEELGDEFVSMVDKWRDLHSAYITHIAHLKIPIELVEDSVLVLSCTYSSAVKGPKERRVQIEQAFATGMAGVAEMLGQDVVDSLRTLRSSTVGASAMKASDTAYNVLSIIRKEEDISRTKGDNGVLVKVSCLVYDKEPRTKAAIGQNLVETNNRVKEIVELINTVPYWEGSHLLRAKSLSADLK